MNKFLFLFLYFNLVQTNNLTTLDIGKLYSMANIFLNTDDMLFHKHIMESFTSVYKYRENCKGYRQYLLNIITQGTCSIKYFTNDLNFFNNKVNKIKIKKMSNFTCDNDNYYLKFKFMVNDTTKAMFIWPNTYYKFYTDVYSNIPDKYF